MIATLFASSMTAPHRQRSLRTLVVMHLFVVGGLTLLMLGNHINASLAGQTLLIAGIVEGALLIGWRLTQLPKSQSLEFLLVSTIQPKRLFAYEALIGVLRLALVTVAALPLLILWPLFGRAEWSDLPPFVVPAFLWGLMTGFGLTTWAYEARGVRRIGEIIGVVGIVLYLLVGVLAGEKLGMWLNQLPALPRSLFLESFVAMHRWNPFAVQEYWFLSDRHPSIALERMVGLLSIAAILSGLLCWRAASRLRGHFHDRHYRPLRDVMPADPAGIRDKPLSWWAVRRVMEYSGRMNLYVAGGFGIVYATYLILEQHWPDWLGRSVFAIIERAGGVPTVTTALVLLAAVPAAFQYGLWDSNVHDRLRRLELLLLTEVGGRDYWEAAASAAWRRGRGYFGVAGILWLAAAWSGRLPLLGIVAAFASSLILWVCYFAIGFRAFSGGYQSSGLASFLVMGLPLMTGILLKWNREWVAAWTPPGSVYLPMVEGINLTWLVPPVVFGVCAFWSARVSMRRCDRDLRIWYDKFHGLKLVD